MTSIVPLGFVHPDPSFHQHSTTKHRSPRRLSDGARTYRPRINRRHAASPSFPKKPRCRRHTPARTGQGRDGRLEPRLGNCKNFAWGAHRGPKVQLFGANCRDKAHDSFQFWADIKPPVIIPTALPCLLRAVLSDDNCSAVVHHLARRIATKNAPTSRSGRGTLGSPRFACSPLIVRAFCISSFRSPSLQRAPPVFGIARSCHLRSPSHSL